jgi:hypothetical protein
MPDDSNDGYTDKQNESPNVHREVRSSSMKMRGQKQECLVVTGGPQGGERALYFGVIPYGKPPTL